MSDHCGHCDMTSGPSEDCPEHGRRQAEMPKQAPVDCPTCGTRTKIMERDPGVFDRRCPQCGDWLYPESGEDPQPCPGCDHEPDDHDTQGCRGYTPTWPRLVRCDCTQTRVVTWPIGDDEVRS